MMEDIPSNNLIRCGSSSNKIRQIVRLQQLLKKWKKIAAASPSSTHLQRSNNNNNSINKFLKKTLSFSDKDNNINHVDAVPKGCLAVLCVGKEEEKRFVIPMSYLAHHSFQLLLREAEEEFGFQQQGILKIPCQVSLFEKILKIIQNDHHDTPLPPPSTQQQQQPASSISDDNIIHNVGCCSPENHQRHIMPPQIKMCTT